MRTRLCFALAASLLATSVAQEPVFRPSGEPSDYIPLEVDMRRVALMARVEKQEAIMNDYYKDPSLERAAEILSFRDAQHFLNYRMGFASRMLRQHSAQLQDLLAKVTSNDEYTLYLICAAEWLADTPECSADAAARLEKSEEVRNYLSIGKFSVKPDFTKLENLEAGYEETRVIEMAWGAYDALHEEAILASIVRCAARVAPPAEGVRLWTHAKSSIRNKVPAELGDIVALVAKSSLQKRCERDAALAARVQELVNQLPEDMKASYNKPLPNQES